MSMSIWKRAFPMRYCALIAVTGLWFCLAPRASGQDSVNSPLAHQEDAMQADASSSQSESETEKQSLKQQILQSLPPSISDGLEIDAWAWIGALHQPSHDDFWDVDLSLAVTKSF